MQGQELIDRYEHLKSILSLYGQDLTQGMLVMVIGLILLRRFIRWFRAFLTTRKGEKWPVAKIVAAVYLILLDIIINVSLVIIGLDAAIIVRFVVVISLSAVALFILLRPIFPGLPFRVGNVVLIDDLFGKVAAIDLYHTRMMTFDGNTVFIPNSKILKNVVINYHDRPGRRIKINLRIPCEDDLLQAKQTMEAIMIADPRVLQSPRPQVLVLDVKDGSVGLGARCWADNAKYWTAKCDLTEKIIYGLGHAGVRIALPKQQVYLSSQSEERQVPRCAANSMAFKEADDESR
jgi:small conductance mechanosensitive channel